MLRCQESAGIWEVTFQYLDTPYGEPRTEEYLADIGTHEPVYGEPNAEGQRPLLEDIPRVSQNRPYTGELCAHEVDWLRHLPGRTYSIHRRYGLRQLS